MRAHLRACLYEESTSSAKHLASSAIVPMGFLPHPLDSGLRYELGKIVLLGIRTKLTEQTFHLTITVMLLVYKKLSPLIADI